MSVKKPNPPRGTQGVRPKRSTDQEDPGTHNPSGDPPSTAAREHLPSRRGSVRFSIQDEGTTYFVTVSKFGDGRIAEIFLDAANKPDSQLAAHAGTAAILCSLLLQHRVSVAAIRHSISGPLAVALDRAEREP